MIMKRLVIVIIFVCVKEVAGFYLPGIAPVSYCQEDQDACKVRLFT